MKVTRSIISCDAYGNIVAMPADATPRTLVFVIDKDGFEEREIAIQRLVAEAFAVTMDLPGGHPLVAAINELAKIKKEAQQS